MTAIYTQADLDAAVAAERDRMREFWVNWARKRLEIQHKHYLRDAKLALNGDLRALRNRVAMMEAEPVQIVLSSIRARGET